jgi:hypothetical protein
MAAEGGQDGVVPRLQPSFAVIWESQHSGAGDNEHELVPLLFVPEVGRAGGAA